MQLLGQQLAVPLLEERRVLGMRDRQSALIRQVRLYCDETPLVFARTVIPLSTLTGKQRAYGNLGNRPLGALLFADRTMRRDELTVNCLQQDDRLHAFTLAEDDVWGRRSVFHVGNKPLLVSEYFLPSLL